MLSFSAPDSCIAQIWVAIEAGYADCFIYQSFVVPQSMAQSLQRQERSTNGNQPLMDG